MIFVMTLEAEAKLEAERTRKRLLAQKRRRRLGYDIIERLKQEEEHGQEAAGATPPVGGQAGRGT